MTEAEERAAPIRRREVLDGLAPYRRGAAQQFAANQEGKEAPKKKDASSRDAGRPRLFVVRSPDDGIIRGTLAAIGFSHSLQHIRNPQFTDRASKSARSGQR